MRDTRGLPSILRILAGPGAAPRLIVALVVLCLATLAALGTGLAGKTSSTISSMDPAAATEMASSYDWLQFNGGPMHSGYNRQETTITQSNVASLTRLFQVSLPAVADGAPVYLSGVNTPSGTRDLLCVTTKAGDIVALDAHTGDQVWAQQNPAGDCRVNRGSTPCYTTSSPAIDPNRQYVYSYGLGGMVHKYRVGDGTEITGGGWPQVATLKPYDEKGSSDLATATDKNGVSYLYVVNSGYLGDRGNYQGHVTAINLADGSQNVFNALCSDQTVHFSQAPGEPDCSRVQAGIWARPGVVYDPDTDRIYAVTGNGDYNPSQHDWGDSVFALNPDGTGTKGNPLDSYTPQDYQHLQSADLDLGSTAPAILPVPSNSAVRHLAVQGGKDAELRLLDLENLNGHSGPGYVGGEVGAPVGVPQGGQLLTMPAVWVNPDDNSTWLFLANGSGISGMKLSVDGNGTPGLQAAWKGGPGGTSPIVANGVLYYASSSGIRAVNPTSGALLWEDTSIRDFHWESPIVADGVLYIADESGNLTAFGLPAGS